MANKSTICVNIDTELKNSAESILTKFGISPSTAIQMFYSQIVLNKDLPFPYSKLATLDTMIREQLDQELEKGINSIKAGNVYTVDEVDEMFAKEMNI